ncbi:MAG: MucR family transcriptional regulator [Pseudomonadota bacterium]
MAKQTQEIDASESIALTTEIVAAYVSNNSVQTSELPLLLNDVFATLSGLATKGVPGLNLQDPAVPINKSVTPDFVICLEDGKKLKMLKRYLRTHFDMSPEEYRHKWGLPADYPMVAPNYAKRRSQFAKDIGLGTAKTKKKTTRKRAKRKKS